MLKKFFEYLDLKLTGTGVVTSADLFGMTTTNTDDLKYWPNFGICSYEF